MNEQLVKSVAQTILSMSAEEKQMLEEMVSSSEEGVDTTDAVEATDDDSQARSQEDEVQRRKASLAELFAQLESFQIEGGPPDWASRLDDYLREDALSQHE